jgi:hypothetical protein
MRCVTSISCSVLFNGARLDSFRPTRGIWQGDAISPYLFLLAAEGLSCLLKAHARIEDIQGVQVAATTPSINHLLFADDRLLFFGANTCYATFIEALLLIYCNASGQQINKDKSSIFFSKGVPEVRRNMIKQILEVRNESLDEKYLGLPSDVGRSKNGCFKYLKDRIWKKVQWWMEKLLLRIDAENKKI